MNVSRFSTQTFFSRFVSGTLALIFCVMAFSVLISCASNQSSNKQSAGEHPDQKKRTSARQVSKHHLSHDWRRFPFSEQSTFVFEFQYHETVYWNSGKPGIDRDQIKNPDRNSTGDHRKKLVWATKKEHQQQDGKDHKSDASATPSQTRIRTSKKERPVNQQPDDDAKTSRRTDEYERRNETAEAENTPAVESARDRTSPDRSDSSPATKEPADSDETVVSLEDKLNRSANERDASSPVEPDSSSTATNDSRMKTSGDSPERKANSIGEQRGKKPDYLRPYWRRTIDWKDIRD